MKIVRQKLEENRRVYEGGRLEKNAVKMQSEAERTVTERSRDSFQEREQAQVREQPRSAEELREPKETILVREEQELFAERGRKHRSRFDSGDFGRAGTACPAVRQRNGGVAV